MTYPPSSIVRVQGYFTYAAQPMQFGPSSGAAVSVRVTKPDGSVVTGNCSYLGTPSENPNVITGSGYWYYDLAAVDTSAPGSYPAIFSINQGFSDQGVATGGAEVAAWADTSGVAALVSRLTTSRASKLDLLVPAASANGEGSGIVAQITSFRDVDGNDLAFGPFFGATVERTAELILRAQSAELGGTSLTELFGRVVTILSRTDVNTSTRATPADVSGGGGSGGFTLEQFAAAVWIAGVRTLTSGEPPTPEEIAEVNWGWNGLGGRTLTSLGQAESEVASAVQSGFAAAGAATLTVISPSVGGGTIEIDAEFDWAAADGRAAVITLTEDASDLTDLGLYKGGVRAVPATVTGTVDGRSTVRVEFVRRQLNAGVYSMRLGGRRGGRYVPLNLVKVKVAKT